MAINNWRDFLTSWVPAGAARRTEADAVCGNEASVGITEWGNHRVYTRITPGSAPHTPTAPQNSMPAVFRGGGHHGTWTNQERQEGKEVGLDKRTLDASQSECLKKL